MRKSTRVSSSILDYLPEPLSNSPRVARLTNCRSILLQMTANFLSRNCSTACRSQMRKADRWQRSPGSRHWRRQRHSLGSFGPWNKRGRRRSVLLRAQNRSPRAGCKSPHSTSRHRPTRRLDAQRSSGSKLVAARQQVSERATDAIKLSSVRSLFSSPCGRLSSYSQALILKSAKASPSLVL